MGKSPGWDLGEETSCSQLTANFRTGDDPTLSPRRPFLRDGRQLAKVRPWITVATPTRGD